MSLYENICSPELLGNSALCQRNASSQENKIQQDRSSLGSLQRKSISVFLTLRDWCPFEKGNLRALIECLNLAHPKAVFWGLIRKRDIVSSLSFKGSRWISTQHRVKAWKSLPWHVTDDESCGFILSLGKAELPLFICVPQFPFLLVVFLFTQSTDCPTSTHTAKHQKNGGVCWSSTWCQMRFPEIYGHENPFIQQACSKNFGAGWCFQAKDKKEKPFRPPRGMKLEKKPQGAFCALLPGFTSLEQRALSLPGAAVAAR